MHFATAPAARATRPSTPRYTLRPAPPSGRGAPDVARVVKKVRLKRRVHIVDVARTSADTGQLRPAHSAGPDAPIAPRGAPSRTQAVQPHPRRRWPCPPMPSGLPRAPPTLFGPAHARMRFAAAPAARTMRPSAPRCALRPPRGIQGARGARTSSFQSKGPAPATRKRRRCSSHLRRHRPNEGPLSARAKRSLAVCKVRKRTAPTPKLS